VRADALDFQFQFFLLLMTNKMIRMAATTIAKMRTATTTPAIIRPDESLPSLLTGGGERNVVITVVSEVEEDGGLGSVGGGVSPSGVDGVVMGGGGRSTTDGVGVGVGTAEV
jgi:hypothetical protein